MILLKAQAAASPIMLATVEREYFGNASTSSAFYWNGLNPCDVSVEANDAVLAYRLWEISEALLIDRTGSFDSYLHTGDEFSSYLARTNSSPSSSSNANNNNNNNSDDMPITPESLSKSSSIDQAEADNSA